MTPLISGCLIVKNEAANLARCLSSISPFIDELVVVDTGSTDETVAIAHDFGALVHHFEWCDDFSAARNFALQQVRGQWTLMLDADEEIIGATPDWIKRLPNDPKVLALQIDLRSPEDSTTVLQAIRLFRNQPVLRYVGRYHEHLMLNQQPLPAAYIQRFSEFKLMHYGYAMDILPHKSRLRLPMLERLRETEGLSYMLLWTLSGMYECTGQLEKAQGCYQEASERLFENLVCGNKPVDFRAVPSWLFGLGERYLNSEDYESVQLICNCALEWCPTFPPISYLTGLLIQSLGFARGAIPYFEACLQFEQTGAFLKSEPFAQDLLNLKPHYQLGLIYRQLHEHDKAVQHFTACTKLIDDFAPALEQLHDLGVSL